MRINVYASSDNQSDSKNSNDNYVTKTYINKNYKERYDEEI